jgi:hypothetical protein
MRRILLLSDTHGTIDQRILQRAEAADEIWHAGDIGSNEVADRLEALHLLRAVFGNIDDHQMRLRFPEDAVFSCEALKVLITHIAGTPGRYPPAVRQKLAIHRPDLFICGHSHILKVQRDQQFGHLHMNPGAAGKHGFHKIRTVLEFVVDGKEIRDLNAVEIGLRGALEE